MCWGFILPAVRWILPILFLYFLSRSLTPLCFKTCSSIRGVDCGFPSLRLCGECF